MKLGGDANWEHAIMELNQNLYGVSLGSHWVYLSGPSWLLDLQV